MADERIPVTYSLEGKDIHRRKGEGDKIIEDKVVATYDGDAKVVTFPSLIFLKNYKTGVTTYLAANEMTVRSFQRADIEPDKPLTKAIPPRPKKLNSLGDKTPEVVQWYFDHRPNEFKARYGVIGKYTGPVRYKAPYWEKRAIDGMKEFRGEQWVETDVVNVIVATRSIDGINGKLTYTEGECVNWMGDDTDESEDRKGDE